VIVSLELLLRRPVYYESRIDEVPTLPFQEFPSFAKQCIEPGCFIFGSFINRSFQGRKFLTKPEDKLKPTVITYAPARATCCDIVRVVIALLSGNAQGVARFIFGKPPTATGSHLDYYSSHSWDVGRSDPAPVPISKKQVAIPAAGVNDTSFQVSLGQFDAFLKVLCGHFESAPSSLAITFGARFVPKANGGILAANSMSDVISFDLIRLGNRTNEDWIVALMDKLYNAQVKCTPHVGKSIVHHKVFRESLTSVQRSRFVKVRQEFDPKGVFDGGQTKLKDIFDLDS